MKGRVILQDVRSGEYVSSNGGWVGGCQGAHVFEHTWMAMLEGLKHGGRMLQVVWCFRNPSANLYAPVKVGEEIRACVECPLVKRAKGQGRTGN